MAIPIAEDSPRELLPAGGGAALPEHHGATPEAPKFDISWRATVVVLVACLVVVATGVLVLLHAAPPA